MSQHCRANPCCGDRPCTGIPLPQHASGLTSHNKGAFAVQEKPVASADLLARIEALETALRPFAWIANVLDNCGYDDAEFVDDDDAAFQAGDFRRARAVLAASPSSVPEAQGTPEPVDMQETPPKLPPYSQSAFPHGFHELWTETQMRQFARDTAAFWRNDVVEKAAQIAERYDADPWIARDIRSLATTSHGTPAAGDE